MDIDIYEKILSFLIIRVNRPHTLQEICEYVGCDIVTAVVCLDIMQEKFFVEKTKDSSYQLATPYQKNHEAYYWRNNHFVAHFENPSEIPIGCRMKLTCNLLGCVRGWAHKQGRTLSVAECRAVIEKEGWKEWEYAVTENLPPPADPVPELPKPEWYDRLYVKETLLEASAEESKKWVDEFLDDLFEHKKGIVKVCLEIMNLYDPRFEILLESCGYYEIEDYAGFHFYDMYDKCFAETL